MSNIKIHALKAFTMRDSSTGKLTSIAHGAIADVDSTVGSQLITDGLAEAYTLITPTGKKTITENGTNIDVAQYEKADVAVPLPTGKITITENGTDIDVSSYASADVNVSGGSSDFSTAEVTIHFTFNETADIMENPTAGICLCVTDDAITNNASLPMNDIPIGSTSADIVITVPMYKNKAIMDCSLFGMSDNYSQYWADMGGTLTATGNATIDDWFATITGNCTLNVPMRMNY